MSIMSLVESKIKGLHWYDISLIKLATAAFVLMIAKLWQPILALDWYWYLIVAVLASVVPCKKVFC